MLDFNWEKELNCKIIRGGLLLHQLKSLNPRNEKDKIADIVNMYFEGPIKVTYCSPFKIAFFESNDEFHSFFNYLKNTYPKGGHDAYIVEVTEGKVDADQLDLIHKIIKQISDPNSKHFLKPIVVRTVQSYDF